MKNNKLSLVRETILPLSSDDLSQVAGGCRDSGCIPQPSIPRPRPSVAGSAIGSAILSGLSGISGKPPGERPVPGWLK